MKTYKYFDLAVAKGTLYLWSTDPDTLQLVVTSISNILPYQVYDRAKLDTLHAAYPYRYVPHKFGGSKEYDAFAWVVNQLCSLGWEPLTVFQAWNGGSSAYPMKDDRVIAFRQTLDHA